MRLRRCRRRHGRAEDEHSREADVGLEHGNTSCVARDTTCEPARRFRAARHPRATQSMTICSELPPDLVGISSTVRVASSCPRLARASTSPRRVQAPPAPPFSEQVAGRLVLGRPTAVRSEQGSSVRLIQLLREISRLCSSGHSQDLVAGKKFSFGTPLNALPITSIGAKRCGPVSRLHHYRVDTTSR
jgi:hypothetical protein